MEVGLHHFFISFGDRSEFRTLQEAEDEVVQRLEVVLGRAGGASQRLYLAQMPFRLGAGQRSLASLGTGLQV